MNNNEIYIPPDAAQNSLKTAYERFQPVYLYGVSGCGKTALIQHFFKDKEHCFLNGEDVSAESLEEFLTAEKSKIKIVVIDNLQSVREEEVRQKILRLVMRRDIWTVLAGRCRYPSWLLTVSLKWRSIAVIEEEQFLLGDRELEKLMKAYHVYVSEEETLKLQMLCKGHGMALKQFFLHLSQGKKLNDDLFNQVVNDLLDYMEIQVVDQWDLDLQEFLLQVSIVEKFNVHLAEMITGRKNVESLLKLAQETGNFLVEADGMYVCRPALLMCMQRKLKIVYTQEQQNELYYNAGLYYEQEEQALEALKMYKACGNESRISGILISNARTAPNSSHIYELRQYYLSLPKETIESSTELMAGMSMLQSILMNVEESERWYGLLQERMKNLTGSYKKTARNLLAYLDIALPQRESSSLIECFKTSFALMIGGQIKLPEFSVTSNLPSTMNGGKDFCEWSRRDRELAVTIGKVLTTVLGKYGNGLVDLALAESFFEKGEDLYEIITHVNRGRMEAESGGKAEMIFVAVGMLARVYLIQGKIGEAAEQVSHFRQKLLREGGQKMLANLEAFSNRLALYEGEKSRIFQWMENAPNEDIEFYTLNRYQYMTKARVYILYGKYEKAINLLQRMLYYADVIKRPYIEMESKLLLAVVLFRCGSTEWKKNFSEMYRKAESYHFVRLISREGAAVLDLLKEWEQTVQNERDGEFFCISDKAFWKQVMTETTNMARYYPSYLKEHVGENETFHEHAIQILKMQAEGYSNAEIAHLLGIKESTVKYHCLQTYKKLGVSGKAAAVTEAKRRGLI
ncbi:MAG: LuxR family transcriptional regulator [Lachnospiraceae bacterium]|nr:LuxR family transcriptional regulator [Lachnospiraceae bacterium]